MEQSSRLNFALIGGAGYIAPRHMKAIKDTGNNLVAALDPYDGIGVMDSYFPEAEFFIEPERFDRRLDKLRREELKNGSHNHVKVDYVSICSPNYMHDSHIRLALRNDAYAICEKPIVLNPWNIDALSTIENEFGKKVYTILQVRLHPAIIALKKRISEGPKDKMYNLDLTYITSRGKWYFRSWKGNVEKSGGIATNIGVHFFDLLTWVFGSAKENIVHVLEPDRASGFIQLEQANIRWFLSLNYMDIPENIRKEGKRTYRTLSMDGEEIEFSEGFTDLHTEAYRQILNGTGFGLMDAKPSIEIVHDIRVSTPIGLKNDYHPILKQIS